MATEKLQSPFPPRINADIRVSINIAQNLPVPSLTRPSTTYNLHLFHRQANTRVHLQVRPAPPPPPMPPKGSSKVAAPPTTLPPSKRVPYPAKHEVVALGHESVIHAHDHNPGVPAHISNARHH